MPDKPNLLKLRAHIEASAPRTAQAIRMLNIEIATVCKRNLPAADFARLFSRQAALVRAAVGEASAIRRFSAGSPRHGCCGRK